MCPSVESTWGSAQRLSFVFSCFETASLKSVQKFRVKLSSIILLTYLAILKKAAILIKYIAIYFDPIMFSLKDRGLNLSWKSSQLIIWTHKCNYDCIWMNDFTKFVTYVLVFIFVWMKAAWRPWPYMYYTVFVL